ncbi:unnamed protein product, partial [Calicophoron daubneyi]
MATAGLLTSRIERQLRARVAEHIPKCANRVMGLGNGMTSADDGIGRIERQLRARVAEHIPKCANRVMGLGNGMTSADDGIVYLSRNSLVNFRDYDAIYFQAERNFAYLFKFSLFTAPMTTFMLPSFNLQLTTYPLLSCDVTLIGRIERQLRARVAEHIPKCANRVMGLGNGMTSADDGIVYLSRNSLVNFRDYDAIYFQAERNFAYLFKFSLFTAPMTTFMLPSFNLQLTTYPLLTVHSPNHSRRTRPRSIESSKSQRFTKKSSPEMCTEQSVDFCSREKEIMQNIITNLLEILCSAFEYVTQNDLNKLRSARENYMDREFNMEVLLTEVSLVREDCVGRMERIKQAESGLMMAIEDIRKELEHWPTFAKGNLKLVCDQEQKLLSSIVDQRHWVHSEDEVDNACTRIISFLEYERQVLTKYFIYVKNDAGKNSMDYPTFAAQPTFLDSIT